MLGDRVVNDWYLRVDLQHLVMWVLRHDAPVRTSRHTTHYAELSWSLHEDTNAPGLPKTLHLDTVQLVLIKGAHEGILHAQRRNDRLQVESMIYVHIASGLAPHERAIVTSSVPLSPHDQDLMEEVRASCTLVLQRSHLYFDSR